MAGYLIQPLMLLFWVDHGADPKSECFEHVFSVITEGNNTVVTCIDYRNLTLLFGCVFDAATLLS